MDQINQVKLAIAAGRTTTIERLTRDATADFAVENWKSAKMQQGRVWDFINTVAVCSGLEIINMISRLDTAAGCFEVIAKQRSCGPLTWT